MEAKKDSWIKERQKNKKDRVAREVRGQLKGLLS